MALSEDPQRPAKRVYNEVIRSRREELNQDYTDEQIGLSLMTYDNLKSFAYRERRAHLPKLPRSREEIIMDLE